jgi:hypothetical protein
MHGEHAGLSRDARMALTRSATLPGALLFVDEHLVLRTILLSGKSAPDDARGAHARAEE